MSEYYFLFILSVVTGLFFGSFLNVLIYRLPIMIELDWKKQARELLEIQHIEPDKKPFNLAFPCSTCPSCGHKIKPWENIPVLSWIFLKGKCSKCKTPISFQYPFVELLTALLFGVVYYLHGPDLHTLTLLAFTLLLIGMSGIDAKTTLLPDALTLPLLWLGLIVSLTDINPNVNLEDSLWGAIVGYLSLWIVYWLYKLVTGKEGMGHGDFKLLAAIGAWAGAGSLLWVILGSSIAGAVYGAYTLIKGRRRSDYMPFGPFLAAAGWLIVVLQGTAYAINPPF